METRAIVRALQRSVDQQMVIHRTHQLLVAAVQNAFVAAQKKAFDAICIDAQMTLTFVQGLVADALAADLLFFKRVVKPLAPMAAPNIHKALKSNRMAIHLRNAQTMLFENDGALFHGLLEGKLPDFAAAKPTDFVQLWATWEYFGGAKPSALSTLLFETLFVLTGHTIANISNACGILQKMNLPNDVRVPSGKESPMSLRYLVGRSPMPCMVESPWLIRGPEKGCDILGMVHSGYLYGGCREPPETPEFDTDVFRTLLSPLSPEDCTSLVYASLGQDVVAGYGLPFGPSTADMQYGYRRHLRKDPNFRLKAKLNCGVLSEPLMKFFDELFVPTDRPAWGDVVIVNNYDLRSPEQPLEDVIYGGPPVGGHAGFFWDYRTILTASRELETITPMEGIGFQPVAPSSKSVPERLRYITYMKITSEMDAIANPPSFAECAWSFEERLHSIDPVDFGVRWKISLEETNP